MLSTRVPEDRQSHKLRLCALFQWRKKPRLRKPLRVTKPKGFQRSYYFISMPMKYGAPVTTIIMLLHFTMSQSIFVTHIIVYLPNGVEDSQHSYFASVFSCIAIIICKLTALV